TRPTVGPSRGSPCERRSMRGPRRSVQEEPGVKTTYDALIVGGGHNGLVAACYLAKAGFSVCVLERYHEVGGAAFTQEIHPGFHLSEGSYVLSLMPRQILDELGAWDGIHLIKRNPRF